MLNSALGELIVVVAQADQLQFIAVMQAIHRRVLPLRGRCIQQQAILTRTAGGCEQQRLLSGGVGEHLHRIVIGTGAQIDRLALMQLRD